MEPPLFVHAIVSAVLRSPSEFDPPCLPKRLDITFNGLHTLPDKSGKLIGSLTGIPSNHIEQDIYSLIDFAIYSLIVNRQSRSSSAAMRHAHTPRQVIVPPTLPSVAIYCGNQV